MRRTLAALLAAAACSVALPASAQMTPGTVKLLSKNATLTEASTGDAFVALEVDKSAKFLVIGPETLQADLRLNLAAGETQGAPVLLVVLAAGKEVARYRITPKASAETWKGRTDVKPSVPVGFYVDVEAGPHAYEFKVQGAAKGAALLLVPKTKARRPLAANAPVVPSKPPVPAPSPTPTAVASASPAPTPAVVSTPKPLEDLAGDGPRADQLRRARRTYEAAFKAGFAAPAQEGFDGTAALGAEARWAFGARRSIAAGLEVQQLAFSSLLPDDPDRAEPPTAVDVMLLPVSVNGLFFAPLESRLQPYLGAGATLAYGSSVTRRIDRGSISEGLVGFGGQLLGGIQYDLGGTDLQEGRQKVFLEVKGSYLELPFEEHAFTDWSTVQVLVGGSLKF